MISGTLPRLRIVVLAAGFSARLGPPKALARVGGMSLLRRTLAAVAPSAGPHKMIVVVPPRARRYRIGLRAPTARHTTFVVNPLRSAGLATSIRCGIEHARYSAAVLLLPVDLVHLEARDIGRLVLRWRGARRRVIARIAGNAAATPVILPHALYLRALGHTGDQGLRDLIRALPADDVCLLRLPSAEVDVDTPQDLARARRRLSRRPS